MTNEIFNSFDDGFDVLGLFLDIAKAFVNKVGFSKFPMTQF